MNGAPRIRTPSRRSGARSCHAPGGVAARGPPVGVLRSVAHRRAESRFWGVFIIAVHRAFVLGLGARHRGIVELSEGVIRCVTVFACYSSSSSSLPHSYQRSTWSLHTLIFCTSVRWNLSILWFLLAGLALQVDSPSSVSSLRTSGRSPTSGWSSLRTPG